MNSTTLQLPHLRSICHPLKAAWPRTLEQQPRRRGHLPQHPDDAALEHLGQHADVGELGSSAPREADVGQRGVEGLDVLLLVRDELVLQEQAGDTSRGSFAVSALLASSAGLSRLSEVPQSFTKKPTNQSFAPTQ